MNKPQNILSLIVSIATVITAVAGMIQRFQKKPAAASRMTGMPKQP